MKADSIKDRDEDSMLHSMALTNTPLSRDQLTEATCHLSRALWLLLSPDAGLDLEDERNRCAVLELASQVADHASAAAMIMERGNAPD